MSSSSIEKLWKYEPQVTDFTLAEAESVNLNSELYMQGWIPKTIYFKSLSNNTIV